MTSAPTVCHTGLEPRTSRPQAGLLTHTFEPRLAWAEHWMMNVGPEKGAFVDEVIQQVTPTLMVQLILTLTLTLALTR